MQTTNIQLTDAENSLAKLYYGRKKDLLSRSDVNISIKLTK